MPLSFYTIHEALEWLREQRGWNYSDEGLRKLMADAGLPLCTIGNLTVIPQEHLFRLAQRLHKPVRGPKRGKSQIIVDNHQ